MADLLNMNDAEIADLAAREAIREANNLFRRGLVDESARQECDDRGITGQRVMTDGVISHDIEFIRECIVAVANFTAFSEDNDPRGEHDFGLMTICDERVMWKIDYYDTDFRYGSEDPADHAKTARVLTILLASEY